MPSTFNIYCDESGHLEHDGLPYMVLGALWQDADKVREVSQRLRELKALHGLPPHFETKWTKVSPSKVEYYLSVLDYFFDDDDLRFRAIVAPKTNLNHIHFEQTHDTWYFKMYFQLLEVLLSPSEAFHIYLDQKDTASAAKTRKLHEVLCNSTLDFNRRIVQRIQTVRSHEVEQVQLADLLTGAVGYANRALETSEAKLALVQRMRERSGYSLTRSTLLRAKKVNIFCWNPQAVG